MAQERKEYTLYVKNLPAELNEDGIRQVFNPYGEIIGFFHRGDPAGDSWAYISYASYAEAERAVEELHDKCPLYLVVTFAKIKGAQKPPRASSSHSSSDSSRSINTPHKHNDRRSSLNQQRKSHKNDELQTDLNASMKQLHETQLEDNGLDGKLREYVDPNDNANALWSRQKVTITEDGKRHVSNGRGYTLYEITKPMPSVDNLVDTVHARTLRYGKNKLAPLMGKCEHCSKQTAFTCKECGTFYCDGKCQAYDYSRHSTRCSTATKTTPSPPTNTKLSLGERLGMLANRKCDDLNIKPLMNQSKPMRNEEQKSKLTDKWDSEIQPPLPRPKTALEQPSPKAINQTQKLRETAIDASTMQAAEDPDCSNDSIMNHFIVTSVLTTHVYKVTISPGALPNEDINSDEYLEQLTTRIQDRCDQTKAPLNFKPSKVELVCGRKDGLWVRGYIIEFVPCLRMYAIDKGEFVVVDKVQPCPKEYASMDGVCILSDVGEKLPRGKISYTTSKIRFIGDDKQIVLSIRLCLDDNEHRTPIIATLRPSSAERRALRYTKLKDGSTVCVTAYQGPVKLFVRSLEPSKVELFNRLMQNAARFALTASPLKEASIGGMVLARYIDGNYYRALIISKGETDESIKIFYTDFGNTETAKLSDLRVMPTELKGYDSCMSPVVLKSVSNEACMTKECNHYLVSLTANEVPLTCKVDSTDKSIVSLKTSDGEDVSDAINKTLKPSWEDKSKEDKRCYELKDMDLEKLGEVGDTVSAIILSLDYPLGLCYACTADSTLIRHVSQTMSNSIKKYFESSDYYIPRAEEACLIVHDGKGSRAICLQREEDICTLFLLDTAKMLKIKHQDIRYMPKDFLHPGCLANMCEIADLAPKDQEGRYSRAVQRRLEELIPPGKTLMAQIINYDEDGQMYTLKLPQIHSQLVEEGLV